MDGLLLFGAPRRSRSSHRPKPKVHFVQFFAAQKTAENQTSEPPKPKEIQIHRTIDPMEMQNGMNTTTNYLFGLSFMPIAHRKRPEDYE